MKNALFIGVISVMVSLSAHATFEKKFQDNKLIELDLDKQVKSYFEVEANKKESKIGAILENHRNENRDGRNLDGGISDPITSAYYTIVKLDSAVAERAYCSGTDNGQLECNVASAETSYLIVVQPQFCHNSGCDSLSPMYFQVRMARSQTCVGDHPFEENAKVKCQAKVVGSDFMPITLIEGF